MYLRALSRCGGRRPGERCERPGARAGAARGAGGRRRGAARGRAASRAGSGAGGASGRQRWGTGARGLIRQTLPPVETAVGSYRRIIRR